MLITANKRMSSEEVAVMSQLAAEGLDTVEMTGEDTETLQTEFLDGHLGVLFGCFKGKPKGKPALGASDWFWSICVDVETCSWG